MSIDFDESKQRWRVRRREDGRQESRRFATREEAEACEEERRRDATSPEPTPPPPRTRVRPDGNGIYNDPRLRGTVWLHVNPSSLGATDLSYEPSGATT